MTSEDAIKIFNEVLLFGKAQCTQTEFEELAKMSIQALEQKSRKGHWISYSWNDNGIARWGIKCDKCYKKYKYGGELWNNPNFCPNCGSDNREVEE